MLTAYGKRALQAHAKTNCLTEIMIADGERLLEDGTRIRTDYGQRPLAGIPISLKDMVSLAGYDSCIGYSSYVGKPKLQDSPLVLLLRDAGEPAELVIEARTKLTLQGQYPL